MHLQNILAFPLTQLGDGDGEREGVEDGDAGDGEERRTPTLSIKGQIIL